MTTEFIYGPCYSRLQTAGFASADTHATDTISTILWLEHNDHRTDHVTDAWARTHDPLHLDVTTLDQFVGDIHESLTGPQSILDALTRRRLVTEALRKLDNKGVLEQGHRYRDDMMDLFTAIEDEGHDSPEDIRALIADSDLSTRAATVLEGTYARFTDNLTRTVTGAEYTQSEAYRTVRSTPNPFAGLEHDVIVLSGYYDLSANERAVIEALADTLPLIVVLPMLDTPDGHTGPNRAAADSSAFYRELADESRKVSPETGSPLAETAANMYTPHNADHDLSADTCRWVEAPTPDREVRQVARSLRSRLATDGVDPNNVLVVVPGLISYREHVADIFPAHGIEPVTFVTELLYQTYAGDAILGLVALCEDEPSASLLARLVTNPLVTLDDFEGSRVADIARRLPTDNHERLLEEVDADSRRGLETLIEDATRVGNINGIETLAALRSLFEYVDLEDNIEELDEDGADFDTEMESRAFRRVDRALDAINRTARTLELDNILERISAELDQLRVPAPRQATDGVVEVVGPRDAYMQSFEHLYLVGFTANDFPPDSDSPRFFEELEAELPGIETRDQKTTARYQFATMLASAESVYISTPDTTSNDDPLLPSSVLDELARVADIDPHEQDLGNGSREDVQRAVGRDNSSRTALKAVKAATAAGVFEGGLATLVRRGVTCAQHRADKKRTAHDALLETETVQTLHSAEDREPYSPTQLTQYATCGFRYYMDRVLDVQAPEEYSLEPDPLELGTLVHDVLESFYRNLQAATGEPVDLNAYQRSELETRLLEAGERVVQDLDLPYEDVFYERWLTALFAGLGNADQNEYYHAPIEGVDNPAHGLFPRFLDEELDNDARPGWFEVGMDLTQDTDGVFDLELPDGRTVPLAGRIDRITVDATDDPPTGIVHDYKSSSRSQRESIDGVSFQLPLYALAAGQQLKANGVRTPLDAAFYVLDPPDEVSKKWTLRYYLKRRGDGTDDDYQQFIEQITPQRIADVTDGIQGGAFQPTLLDADTAGCRHCDYSDTCDVRHHRRREIATKMDEDERSGYVPQYARADSLLDEVGGDDE